MPTLNVRQTSPWCAQAVPRAARPTHAVFACPRRAPPAAPQRARPFALSGTPKKNWLPLARLAPTATPITESGEPSFARGERGTWRAAERKRTRFAHGFVHTVVLLPRRLSRYSRRGGRCSKVREGCGAAKSPVVGLVSFFSLLTSAPRIDGGGVGGREGGGRIH